MRKIKIPKMLSIRIKLLISYSAVFIIVGIFGSALLYSLIKTTVQENIENRLKNSTTAILNMVDTSIKSSIKNYLYGLSQQNITMVRHFHEKFKQGRLTEKEAKNIIAGILLEQQIGKTGYSFVWDISRAPDSIPLAIHPNIQGNDVASFSFVQTGAALKEGYIEYEWKNPGEKAARKKSMYLSYFEPWQWVIAASSYRDEFYDLINVEDLRENILSARFGETGYPYIMDTSGNVVIHPMLEGINLHNYADEKHRAVVQKVCSLKNGKLTYFWKNPGETRARKKLVIFNYLPEFDWIVASSIYLEEFYPPLHKIKKIFTGLALCCMLLLLIISFLLSSYFTRPIKKLMTSFEKGAKGDFSVRTPIDSSDEIGKLGHYFNSFMKTFERYAGKLEESETKYRSIFENSSEGIFQMDEKGNFINLNPSMRSILGYPGSQDEKPGLSVPNVQTHFPQKKWQEFQKELSIRKVSGFETKFFQSNGHQIWVSINAKLIQSKQVSTPWIEGTFVDISERKNTQAIILQTEKMVSVGGLAAGMAHEINNPLAGMMQNSNVMKSRLTNIDMPANLSVAKELGISMKDIRTFMEKRDIFRMLDAIHESGLRAAEIVDSMLSFARKSDADMSPHYPDQLMDKILDLAATDYDLKKQYDFKTIKIIKEYADNLPRMLCEGGKIQQVLLNILRNGAQAMQTVKTKSPRFILRICSETAPEMVRIEIEDNGPGMDEKTRSKAFDPFFTTKPVGIGTGLGLSVSYFIITENHKGTMEVISEPGKGATFIIRIPIKH